MAVDAREGYPVDIAVTPSAAARLVERAFSLANEGDYESLLELLHPAFEATLKSRPGEPVHDLAEFRSFVYEFVAEQSVFELGVSSVDALDDHRVIVQGRLRWMDEERVLRDDPVVWAIEIEDGLLRRSTALRSLTEAEARLAAASARAT